MMSLKALLTRTTATNLVSALTKYLAPVECEGYGKLFDLSFPGATNATYSNLFMSTSKLTLPTQKSLVQIRSQ